MFFSIIIPMYNVEQYVGKCIGSLLTQSMGDFEIVAVDDGSKDKTADVVRKLSLKDKRVKLLSKENGGQSTARNFGLRHSEGEYVIFIDSDDFVLYDDFLETVRKEIEKTEADVVMYRYHKYFESRTPQLQKCGYSFASVKGETDPSELLPLLAREDAYYGSAWTKAVRRTLLLNNGIEFDESLRCEDIDWSYRVIENTKVLSCVDREFLAYRQREGSVTSQGSYKNAEGFLITVEKYKLRYESPQTGIDENLRRGLLGTLAKYYANLLINYGRIKDKRKKDMKNRLKALAPLLDYAVSSRPQTVCKIYRIFGFTLTVFAINTLDKIKN